MRDIRLLGPGDEAVLERFLGTRPDTTMFLRGNLHVSGIVHTGEAYTADYVAAFEGAEIVGVAAHSWGGNLLVEADAELPTLVRAALEISQRPLAGVIGTGAMVRASCSALEVEGAETTVDSNEDLFALDLEDLIVPVALDVPGTRCRAPNAEELELVVGWRVAYEQEALGTRSGPELDAHARADIERSQTEGRHFVLEEDGRPVSYSAFNAELPDCVQIGGVFTPPELRSGGRARSVVAGSLLLARDRGVRRSVLFTATDNDPAQRAYRALGYQRVGDYAIVLFATPERPV